MRKFSTLLLTALFFAALVLPCAAENIKPVKYVFLFIGDGMSIPQRMTAEEYSLKTGRGRLFINTMPYQAVTSTSSANAFITDSAASGSAIACGEKTVNGCIAMDAKKKQNLISTAKVAKQNGRKVGIISSVTINHATPASFYANNASRGNYYEIALNLTESNFDYFGGGGAAKNNDKKSKFYKGDIYELAADNGFKVARDRQSITSLPLGKGKIFAAGAPGALPYAIDRKAGDMHLSEFVKQAIKHLDNEKGFFIMAEGGMIDWVCHSNDAGTTIQEILDFDNAVKVAYEFAQKHPQETLIVVTGDHETGGLTLGFAGSGYKSNIELLKHQKCSIGVLGEKIAELGKKEGANFADAKKIINENFNMYFADDKNQPADALKLSADEAKQLADAFARQFPQGKYKKGSALTREIIRIFNRKCGLAWSSGNHTALPVLTTAYGTQAEIFKGFIDNTDISKKLKQAVR